MKHDNSIEKVTQPWLLFWYFWKHLTWYDTYAKFYIQALTCSGFMIGDSVPIPTPPPFPPGLEDRPISFSIAHRQEGWYLC